MKNYQQKELNALITCPKRIIEPPRKEMKLERGSFRNDFGMESVDDETGFSAFMRVNERFSENFSIGLRAHPRDERESFCLLRYNGPHGDHVNNPLAPDPHYGYHIHEARPENIQEDFPAELYAELTESYGSYDEALIYFLTRINVKNADQYFDIHRQFPLFSPD